MWGMNGYWGSKSSVVNAPDSLFLFRYPPFFRLHQFVGDRNHGLSFCRGKNTSKLILFPAALHLLRINTTGYFSYP